MTQNINNLLNPPPTYHFEYENENERNGLPPRPSPIFYPRHTHSFSPSFAPLRYVEKNELFPDEDELLLTMSSI
jgi:hypothetical protein